MNSTRFLAFTMTILIGFLYLVVLTRGHLTVIPH
jgi:hypothetical protein